MTLFLYFNFAFFITEVSATKCACFNILMLKMTKKLNVLNKSHANFDKTRGSSCLLKIKFDI